MIKYDDEHKRPSSEDIYYLVCNGSPIVPLHDDMFMDYWTAETVVNFLDTVNPFFTFEIVKAEYLQK